MVGGALGIVALIIASGFVLGLVWSTRSESARVAELTDEVTRLRLEASRLDDLAGRLATIESDYARLRAAVTEGAPSVRPGVALPSDLGVGSRADASPATPAWPLAQRGFVTRAYGSPDGTGLRGHTGVDIAVPTGSYVRAMAAGRVEEAGEDEVYGRYVRIAHGGGLSSLYGHNSWLFVQPGDSVQRLQVIALTGNTGRSTAPHLHFELSRDGQLMDPLAFVNQGGGAPVGTGQASVEQR